MKLFNLILPCLVGFNKMLYVYMYIMYLTRQTNLQTPDTRLTDWVGINHAIYTTKLIVGK